MPPEDDDKGLLDAVSAAIDEETFVPEEDGYADGDESTPEAGDGAGDESDGDDSPEGAADAPDGEDGSDEPEKGDEPTDPDVPDGDAGEDSGEPGEEPAADEPEKAEQRQEEADPVNDPIPENVKGRTRERIETLVGKVKEFEQYKTNYEEMQGYISSTGATPEEFANLLNYARMVRSDNPEDKRAAFEAAKAELKALAIQLGETDVPGFDPVSEFKDLATAVEAQEITPEHAREIALSRLRKQDELARETRRNQERQQQTSAEQAVEQGRRDLAALEERLRSDPNYEAKRAVLVPALRETFRRLHPSEYAAAFEAAYKNFNLPAQPAAPAPRPAPKQQPLRGKQPAGNADRGINSPLDAINEALGSMGR